MGSNKLTWVKKVISFPYPELEKFWWNRMFKIVVWISVVIIFFFSIQWGNEFFKPYNVYSFDNDLFNKYATSYRIEDCSTASLCGEDEETVVFKYEASGIPGAYDYVSNRENQGKDFYQIFNDMKADGLLDDLKAVDLQNNFSGEYFKIAYIIILPFIWYLFCIQVIYRIIAYVIAGKKNHE